MNPIGFVIAACGAFALCGAGFDWDWFMHHRKARLFSALFGRGGARACYSLLGSALVVVGVMIAFGIITEAA